MPGTSALLSPTASGASLWGFNKPCPPVNQSHYSPVSVGCQPPANSVSAFEEFWRGEFS